MESTIHIFRRKKRISQVKMAKELDVSPSYLCKVERGGQEPSESFMEKCAQYLQVPMDELFPRSKASVKDIIRQNSEIPGNLLWQKRQEKKLKQVELAKMLGCSPSYLSRIEKGVQAPTEQFKSKCARILRIKKSILFPCGEKS